MPTARHVMLVFLQPVLEIQLIFTLFQELTNDISCWSLCFLFQNHFSFLVQNEAICLFYLLYTCTARSDQLSPCWEDCPKITFSMRLYKTVPLWYSLTTKTNIRFCSTEHRNQRFAWSCFVAYYLFTQDCWRICVHFVKYLSFQWFDIYKWMCTQSST